ncbi:MAG: winged helix-turn-helix transcriptional regulator [Clostridiales bacterium]|nr:winged helix-turn-helix transcriptional regulator [Clostridiales bacterium]
MRKSALACDCDIIHYELVEKAKKNLLKDEILIDIANFYRALADNTRIKIINLLLEHELCVCDISAILNLTKSTVSHQLKNLREMNLVKNCKKGKQVWYSLADSHVRQVFEISLIHIKEGIIYD